MALQPDAPHVQRAGQVRDAVEADVPHNSSQSSAPAVDGNTRSIRCEVMGGSQGRRGEGERKGRVVHTRQGGTKEDVVRCGGVI